MVSSSNGPPVVLEAAMGFFVQPEPGQVRWCVCLFLLFNQLNRKLYPLNGPNAGL
jgi:hypothetical protein